MSISVQQDPYLPIPVRISSTWFPTFRIGLTIDELQVMGALGITVSSTILGTSTSIFGFTSICIHLHEIQSAVDSTIKLGIIHSVSELLVLQLEEHVRVFGVHEIRSRSNILAVRTLGHKAELKGI